MARTVTRCWRPPKVLAEMEQMCATNWTRMATPSQGRPVRTESRSCQAVAHSPRHAHIGAARRVAISRTRLLAGQTIKRASEAVQTLIELARATMAEPAISIDYPRMPQVLIIIIAVVTKSAQSRLVHYRVDIDTLLASIHLETIWSRST